MHDRPTLVATEACPPRQALTPTAVISAFPATVGEP